jgi:ADP-ribose pyrophosphatase
MISQRVEEHFRFCPRCGTENPNRGSVPFRCAECRYAEFFGPVAAVGALIINQANELLLVRRACQPGKGKWGLPGGFVDRDETMEEAVARETREETQLKIISSAYLMTFPNHYDYRGVVIPVIDLFFLCRVAATDRLALKQDELDYHEWVRPSETQLDNMAFHSNRLAIEKWLGSER